MNDFMILLTGHRMAVIGVVALSLWVGAFGMYARRYLKGYFNRTRPHSWTIDMANKRATSRGRFEA